MKRFALICLILATGLAFVHSQKKVIGTVNYAYNVTGEGAEDMTGVLPEKMIIKFGENGLSMVMQGGMMAATMGKTVVNGESGEAFIVKDNEQTVYILSPEEVASQAATIDAADIEKTEETKEVLGYNCTKYRQTVTTQGISVSQSLWITEDLIAPEYDKDIYKGIVAQNGMNLNIKGFPLLIEVEMPGMPIILKMEVTNIEFGAIDPSEFAKPEGYTEKPFSEMNPF